MITLAGSMDFRLTFPADYALTQAAAVCRVEVLRLMRSYLFPNGEGWPGSEHREALVLEALVLIDRRRTLISERVIEVLEGAFR